MRKGEGRWPRSFEFPFHGGKRWWVAPADAENEPQMPGESMKPCGFGCHGVLEAARVNGTFPCDKCGVKSPVLWQEQGQAQVP